MRILHSPVNIGNQPWTLSRYERVEGLTSDLIVNYSTWLQYPSDIFLGREGDQSLRNKVKRVMNALFNLCKYDVFHYYFGRSQLSWVNFEVLNCLWFVDLKLAKFLGKKVFMTLQGCDVRLAGRSNQKNEITACKVNGCSFYQNCFDVLDKSRLELINKILPLCDHVFFLNPELGHFIKKGTFLPYSNVDVEKIIPKPFLVKSKPVILHAPTSSSIKGSYIIEQALKILKTQYDFEYKKIENLPHADAMQHYQEADLVIDQVLLGWYGGFAVEAMAMQKPVLCYIREDDLRFIPKDMARELPIIRVDINNLVEQLKHIFDAKEQWQIWGIKSREFVLKWHNPRLIAKAMKEVYHSPKSDFPFFSEY